MTTIATELQKVIAAKADIDKALQEKGVTVPSGEVFNEYPKYICQINRTPYGYNVYNAVYHDDPPSLNELVLHDVNRLSVIKEEIRQAIIKCGVDVPANTPFSQYGNKIRLIEDWGDIYYYDETDTSQVLHYKLKNQADWNALANSAEDGDTNATSYKCSFSSGLKVGITYIAVLTIGKTPTYIPNNFLDHAQNLQSIEELDTSNITTIGDMVFSDARRLNQPLTMPSKLKSIGRNFLSGTYLEDSGSIITMAFNSVITLNEGLQSIGAYFLAMQTTYNKPITIPSTVKSIGERMFAITLAFNSAITFNQSSEWTLGEAFLYQALAYNQPINLGNKLKALGSYSFMYMNSFNNTVNFGSSIKSVGDYVFGGCPIFNKPVSLPATVTSIGVYFLSICPKFNSAVTWTGLQTLGFGAFWRCTDFQQNLTLPTGMVFSPKSSDAIVFIFKESGGIPYTGTLNVNNVAPGSSEIYTLASISTTTLTVSGTCNITGSTASTWKSTYPNYTNASASGSSGTVYINRKHN